jgi:carboxypeptidase T
LYGKNIYSLTFGDQRNQNKSKKENESGILFTGIHHGREPITFLMNLNIILKILYEIENNNQDFIELINTRNIHFIPLINVDGYEYNTNLFANNGNTFDMSFSRKNRRIHNSINCKE